MKHNGPETVECGGGAEGRGEGWEPGGVHWEGWAGRGGGPEYGGGWGGWETAACGGGADGRAVGTDLSGA